MQALSLPWILSGHGRGWPRYLPTECVVLPAYVQGRGEPTSMGILVSVMSVGTIVGALLAPPVAFLVTGWSVETFGVQATYLALALVLAATSIGVLFVRSIRDIDD